MSSSPTAGLCHETVAAIDVVTAGMRIASARATDHQVSAKDGRDVVTTADIAVEKAIRSMLTDALSLPSVGEEHGGSGR